MSKPSADTKPLVTAKTTTELLIQLPGIVSPDQIRRMRKCIEKMSEGDEKLQRVFKYSPHLFNHPHDPITLRIATPRELGREHDLAFGFMVDSLAERNNLKHCNDSDAVRLAFQFEEIRSSVPETFLETTWRIYMRPMDFKMSGDMFISGLGCPDPVFEITPHCHRVLGVSWIYQGQSRGACLDDPIVFRRNP